MMDENARALLNGRKHRWLVTGAAGFIGSNIVEALLGAGQEVVGLDNLSTGAEHNLDAALAPLADEERARFTFIRGDVRDAATCAKAAKGATYVLHQAALGSVPRSIHDPLTTHDVNATGFLNILQAARQAGVERVVYASSSAVYGDEPTLPKLEECTGSPLSPYAATKAMNELTAQSFANAYGQQSVGLRYFNIFGPRQDPEGAYAAVIPKWVAAMLAGEAIHIYGDGETSRDFCHVSDVVQANIRAAVTPMDLTHDIYNVAAGQPTTLNDLVAVLRDSLGARGIRYDQDAEHRAFREGDIRHSHASIAKAHDALGYQPTITLAKGIDASLDWYVERARRAD
ncbi:SDR family oxidoreductase [Sphingomicrobium arenosum]|uniref:SDR family oxidoreductase n=1 Tax=Sphingomicrobium arenosum TaxID=2233861 RepID=UPI00223EA222|nr:SDR family oxidoreductase [Sphingomicrobium arenosum]